MDRGGVPGAGELAVRLAEGLLATAKRSDEGWSWGLSSAPGGRFDLTRLQPRHRRHRCRAGRVVRRDPRRRYRDAALAGFEYERSHYDADARNWPNFQTPPRADGSYGCSFSCCHGAPGIGVSRVLAAAHLDDSRLTEEADIAADTTRTFTRGELEFPGKDYMLCHGIAGNLECLWLIDEGLGDTGAPERMQIIGVHGRSGSET